MLGLLFLGWIGLYFRWFWSQHLHVMDRPQDWGHSYLVPGLSAYMIYLKRAELARIRPQTFWPGLAPFVAGIFAYFFGVVGVKNHMVQGFAMILSLMGLVLLLMGPRAMRYLFLPLAVLALGVTLPERVMIQIEFALQLIASKGGWFMLSIVGPLFGLRADLSGNMIEVIETSSGKAHQMGIAEACSGMRMVIAFVALSAAVAVLTGKYWWQRIALLLISVPVAVVMNMVRVTVLGLLQPVNEKLAAGDAHMFIGTVLLIPALLLFMGVQWALDRVVSEPEPVKAAVQARKPAPVLGGGWDGLTSPAFVSSLAILAFCGVGATWAINAFSLYVRKLPVYPPDGRQLVGLSNSFTRNWTPVGADRREAPEIEDTLGTKNYINRTYVHTRTDGNPSVLQVHVAYYTGSVDTVPHVPDRCLVGAGYSIAAGPDRVPVKLALEKWPLDAQVPEAPGRARPRRARLSDLSDGRGSYVHLPRGLDDLAMSISSYSNVKDPRPLFAGYFFLANGAVATTAEEVRLLAFDLKDDYAYYMKVQISSSSVKSEQELASESAELLQELLPELMRFVPDWPAVESGDYPDDNPRRPAGAAAKR